ncbi:MAG: hypothetical protein R3C68_10170 [Myxococcota bacterium]
MSEIAYGRAWRCLKKCCLKKLTVSFRSSNLKGIAAAVEIDTGHPVDEEVHDGEGRDKKPTPMGFENNRDEADFADQCDHPRDIA